MGVQWFLEWINPIREWAHSDNCSAKIKTDVDPRWLWDPTRTVKPLSVLSRRRVHVHPETTMGPTHFVPFPKHIHSERGPHPANQLAAHNIMPAPKPIDLAGESREKERDGEMAESLADMVLGFFEEEWAAGSSGSDDGWISSGEGDGTEAGDGAAEARAFWESQDRLLQEALMRNGSTETRIRGNVEEAVRKLRAEGAALCDCSGGGVAAAGGGSSDRGRGWVLREIAERLREKGYDSAVCRSKWQRSPDIPSGEHSYVDVLIGSRSGLKDPTRILIEPNFKAEFEMARACPEYNSLVARLPEIFVGKTEKLKTVVKVMCRAAKRSLKENKMHMAPWRKQEYMLSKWLRTCERLSPPAPAAVAVAARDAMVGAPRQPGPRASLLTFDLRRTAVKVV